MIATPQKSNAIESLVFFINFDRPFEKGTIEAIDSQYENISAQFPKRIVPKGIKIEVTNDNVSQSFDDPCAILYESFGPNGQLQRSLKIENNTIQIFTTEYTSWSAKLNDVKPLLEMTIIPSLTCMRITALGLNYTDRFTLEENEDKLESILNRECDLLPSHIFSRDNSWHAHTGWFEANNVDEQTRLLHNLNFSFVKDRKKVLKATLLHRIDYLTPMDSSNGDDMISQAINAFTSLHALDKQIFKSALTAEMQSKIGL